MPQKVELDLASGLYRFEANKQVYEIQAGKLITLSDGENVVWDWEIGLELRKADFIPLNKPTALLYSDNSVFVRTQVIGRKKEGGLTVLTLVPYIEGQV
jgi:hypothetical protein